MKDRCVSLKNSRAQITENCQIENFPLQEQLLSPKYGCDQLAESGVKNFPMKDQLFSQKNSRDQITESSQIETFHSRNNFYLQNIVVTNKRSKFSRSLKVFQFTHSSNKKNY